MRKGHRYSSPEEVPGDLSRGCGELYGWGVCVWDKLWMGRGEGNGEVGYKVVRWWRRGSVSEAKETLGD